MIPGIFAAASVRDQGPGEPLGPPEALSASSGDADALNPPEIIE